MRVNKPPMIYFGHLHLKYRGINQTFSQQRSLTKVMIIEKDFNSKEELVVFLKTFDGTEIMFSMVSSNLYIKENGKYKLQDVNEEQETQSFCSFDLLLTDKIMLFDGFMSYRKIFGELYSFKEDFEVRITINENPLLLQTWIQHEQTIITN